MYVQAAEGIARKAVSCHGLLVVNAVDYGNGALTEGGRACFAKHHGVIAVCSSRYTAVK